MFVHSFVSSGLLLLAGSAFHTLRTRSLYLMRSLLAMKESSALLILMLVLCNFAFPPSIGVFGELLSIVTMLNFS